MRIRTKILIQFALLFLSIILIGNVFTYFAAQDAITDRVQAQLESISVLKHQQLEHIVHHYTEHIEEYATESYIEVLTLSYLNNTNMTYTSNEIINAQSDFYKWKEHADFIELFIINNEGHVIYSTDKQQIGKTKSNEPYFQKGKTDTYLQSYYFDISTQKQSVMIATPIVSNKTNSIGILVGRFDLTKINDIMLERSGLGETGETYLVNNINLLVTESKYDENSTFKKFIFTTGVKTALSGENNSGQYLNYIGKEVVGNYRWDSTIGACLVCEIQYDEAYVVLGNIVQTIITAVISLFLIALVIIYIFSRRLSRPLEQLTRATRSIGKQQGLDLHLPEITNDEIGNLTTAFHDMIQDLSIARTQIKEYNEQLELKIYKRTKELQLSKNELEKTIKKQKMTKTALLNMMKDLNQTVDELQNAKDEIEKKNNDLNNAQEDLQKINKNLEKIVSERTKEIKQLLRQKDEFIHQLGHDLKNPLGPLVNLLPMLDKKLHDEKDKEILEVLIRNVQYMRNLVTKTLELARLNSPNTTLNFEQMDLNDELNSIIQKNMYLFKEKNMTIENKISENITLTADKLRIEELYTNLLNNAVKYSNKNGKITLKAKQKDQHIILSIQDDGIGMTVEEIQRLFDEFYKADESRHDFDSSGLGLPIAKRIVEKHGGRIWVESEGKGKGSTFFFSLPKTQNEKENS